MHKPCGKADGHWTPETGNSDKVERGHTRWKRRGKACDIHHLVLPQTMRDYVDLLSDSNTVRHHNGSSTV